jgi:feruloyl esterase
LTYHGRFDPVCSHSLLVAPSTDLHHQLIASGNSKRFYNLISSTLNSSSLDSFYRLFLVPGMSHCQGGSGSPNFGQGGIAFPILRNDSAHNGLLALVDWVENGEAPETITGTAADGITTRVHCRWPEFASKWNGKEWVCAPAKQ